MTSYRARNAFLRSLACAVLLAMLGACAGQTVTPGTPHRFTVTADNHPLALWAREVAQPKGAVLLLHGRTWSALPDFDLRVDGSEKYSVMRALNEKGYSAYALDMRGYGSTPRDASGWLTPDRAAADVASALEWIAHHGDKTARPPALLGWSQGSRVAHLTAQRHPELISDLVLFGYPVDPAKSTPVVNSPATPPRESNDRARAISDFISPAVTPQPVIEAYVRAALAADPVRVDWRDQQQFNELDPAKLRMPTLLMHGERDPLAPIAAQARVFTALGNPDRQWVILAGGDHAALIEDTAPAFIAAIVAFLDRPRR